MTILPKSFGRIKRANGANSTSDQRGMTVMEAVLVFAIIAIVAAAVFGVYKIAFGSSKVSTEKNYLQAIVGQVNNMFGTNRDYGSTNITTALVNAKAAPAAMIVSGGLKNSWNGAVTITGNGDTYTVSEAAVPRAECIELAQVPVNAVAVRINGAAQTLPLSASNVVAACSTDSNTIALDIR